MQGRLQNQYFLALEYVQVVSWIAETEHATDRGSRKNVQNTVREKSDFFEISWKIEAGGGFGHQIQ